jgi:DedD protein
MSWGRRSSGFGYTEFGVNKQFKERLTGAVILVTFAVFIVPALLSGPPGPAVPASTTDGEGPPVRSYTIDLTDPVGARPPVTPTTTVQPAVAPEVGPAAESATATAGTPTPAPTPAPVPAPAQPPAAVPAVPGTAPEPGPLPAGAGFAVQIGSFASRANANGLVAKLHKGGFPAFISPTTGGKKLYRVRVGPVADRAEAQLLATRLASAGQAGKVVSHP